MFVDSVWEAHFNDPDGQGRGFSQSTLHPVDRSLDGAIALIGTLHQQVPS